MRAQTWFFIVIGILGILFLYAERAILSPFILAGVFAYLLNPLVNYFSKNFKVPRTFSILIIYGILIGVFVFSTLSLSVHLFEESSELRKSATQMLLHAKTQLSVLPDWARPTAYQLLTELQKSRFINLVNMPSLFPFVSQAISRVISFLIFLFSGFYFLKDGQRYIDSLTKRIPKTKRKDIEILISKTNSVLGGYLRGEVILIIIMSIFTYIALTIVGVKYAVSLAVFSGFAEIVPLVGPIIAATVAALVAFFGGVSHFNLAPLSAALLVILIYFVLRHAEDYFIAPHIMGRVTKLPAFIIFFAVIAGGHVAGVLGLLLAVPVAAIIKILLEYALEKVAPGSE